MPWSPLPRDFFDRPAPEVAPALLGCVLAHETPEGVVAVELTEVEAYAGEVDPASHAYRGKTPRNAVMYGPPGYAYVYFTYGMHFCVNVVCLPAGTANAVLLRAGRVIAGEDLARRRRTARRFSPGGMTPPGMGESLPHSPLAGGSAPGTAPQAPKRVLPARELARGPARLCQALAIDRAQNGLDFCDPASPLRLSGTASGAGTGASRTISAGPRVGVSAGADTNWRFWVADEPTVSVYRPYKARSR